MNKLEKLKALLEKCPPAPWGMFGDECVVSFPGDGPHIASTRSYGENGVERERSKAQALLIVSMRNYLSDLIAVAEAAQCIRHWHDTDNDGMVVSGEHVRLLWVALLPLTKDTDK
jgi:hypothetical protein